MNDLFDVVIIGGGVVGLTAAVAMAQRAYSVAVLDAHSLNCDLSVVDQRLYAINAASQHLFEQLGIWSHIDAQRKSHYRHMHVWDALSSVSIDFDSRSIAKDYLGTIIEESVLKQALLQQILVEPKVTLFAHTRVDSVQQAVENIQVLSDTKSWKGQLLMIADGALSPTRALVQVNLTTWSYEQSALIARVGTEKSHQQTAYQIFHPEGPLAFLPLSDLHESSIVWSTSASRAQHLQNLSAAEFNAELSRAFEQTLGAVTVLSERHQFPLHMRHVNQYVGKRWLLLGDAAHTIHPLAGLGLNLGLADVSSWLNCLDTNSGLLVSQKSLGAYQRERKSSVWQIIVLMEAIKRLFSHSSSPVSFVRGLGMRWCNEFTPIKRALIYYAAG